jgi:beta-1,4-mannosyltransferase
MKIVFHPIHTKFNKYIDNIVNMLKQQDIQSYALKTLLRREQSHKEISIVHLNWYENLNDASSSMRIYNFMKKMVALYFLKLNGKKIVWTMHNRMPHDQENILLKMKLMRTIVSLSDSIIVHSHSSKKLLFDQFSSINQDKVYFVPHPDYIDDYGPVIDERHNYLAEEPLQLLFMGAVKPYKNIELLIDVIKIIEPRLITLTIAGRVANLEYKQKIEELCRGCSNIILDLEFINDDKVAKILSRCDALVLPYSTESSLNSGSAILAFSYKRTVVCPLIGTIQDIPNKEDVFSYSYTSKEEHKKELYMTLMDCISRKAQILSMGERMFEYVSTFNSKKNVGLNLSKIYEGLS